jgi:hypothetical protein
MVTEEDSIEIRWKESKNNTETQAQRSFNIQKSSREEGTTHRD